MFHRFPEVLGERGRSSARERERERQKQREAERDTRGISITDASQLLLLEPPCSPTIFMARAPQPRQPASRSISVTSRPPCLLRALALGTPFLSNSGAAINLQARSVYVVYDSNVQTSFSDFHYAEIFISHPLCPASKISCFGTSLSDHDFPSFFLSQVLTPSTSAL